MHVQWWPVVLVASCTLLAGCFGGEPAAPDATQATSTQASSGASAGQVLNATPAPTWSAGQSWTWSLASAALANGELELTTSVLDGGGLELGVDDMQVAAFAYPFHLLPIGTVDPACLCWVAHGTPVQFLRFPLEGPDAFTADFWGAPGAQVVVEPMDVATPAGPQAGYRSTVDYAQGGLFAQADYAPALGQFVRMASHFGAEEPFAQATLVRAGSEGGGTPFRATELVRATVGANDPSSLAPRPVTIPGDADHVLLVCFVPAGQGYYAATFEHPGTPIGCAAGFVDRTVVLANMWETQPGPGLVQFVPAGQGNLIVEAFAIDATP